MATSALSILPVRVPIGVVTLPDGVELPILMTPEFARALNDIFVRIGGATGVSTQDLLDMIEYNAIMDAFDVTVPATATAAIEDMFSGAVPVVMPQDTGLLDATPASPADVSALRAEVEALRREIALIPTGPGAVLRQLEDLRVVQEMQAAPGLPYKGTVTGSRAANVALASLLTSLAKANIIIDNSVI